MNTSFFFCLEIIPDGPTKRRKRFKLVVWFVILTSLFPAICPMHVNKDNKRPPGSVSLEDLKFFNRSCSRENESSNKLSRLI